MLIDVAGLIGDSQCGGYVYNDIAEKAIAGVLSSLTGMPVSDFTQDAPRPEYDFKLGEMPVELKITSGVYLPVEMARDEAGAIPSGIALSTAPIILYLSNGHGAKEQGSRPVAKLRAFKRRDVLSMIRNTPPSFYPGKTPMEGALVYYVTGTTRAGRKSPFFSKDFWIGDMEYKQGERGWLIDTDTFTPGTFAKEKLLMLHQAYLEGDIE